MNSESSGDFAFYFLRAIIELIAGEISAFIALLLLVTTVSSIFIYNIKSGQKRRRMEFFVFFVLLFQYIFLVPENNFAIKELA